LVYNASTPYPGIKFVRRIQIRHLTRYHYEEPVTLLPHNLHLRPRDGHDIRVATSKLEISPGYEVRWKRDIYGNSVAVVDFLEQTADLVISSEVVVEHYEDQPLNFLLEEQAQRFPFLYDPVDRIDLVPYQFPTFPQDHSVLKDWIADVWNPGISVDTIDMLTAINHKIANELQYVVREEPGVQSPATTLTTGKGSCRDFATLLIEICRHSGLASRFVSGYLLNEDIPPGNTATHAWLEVFLPGSGWRGLDPTSGVLVSGDHIAVAVHRHPEAIPPVAGSFVGIENTQSQLTVEVRVSRISESD